MKEVAHYVDGNWVTRGKSFRSNDPARDEPVAEAPIADADLVDQTVAAARRAFDESGWREMRGAERGRALLRLADALEREERAVGELVAREMGKPIRIARGREIAGAIDRLRFFAGAARTFNGTFTGGSPEAVWDLQVPEPAGVCALIVPWNDPVDLAIRKLGAALAVGCSVIVKSSEITPASTTTIFELADVLGAFPPGVLNLLHGPGDPTGRALASHPDVDKISFTGSTETGIQVMMAAAPHLKKVSLECGGKAAAVVFADADLEKCVDALSYGAFMYAGQSCTACTRVVVEDSVHDEVVDRMVEASKKLKIGDPLDEDSLVGPVAYPEQYEKAASYIQAALADGARAVLGGPPAGDDLYMDPTILVDVPVDSAVATEEVFGPVLTVHRFKETNEAITIANNTRYGLAGAVWSQDISRALQVARRLDVGDVWVNTHYVRQAETPFGGRHMSGLGREMGLAGLEEYVSWKRICVDTRDHFHLKRWFEEGQDFRG